MEINMTIKFFETLEALPPEAARSQLKMIKAAAQTVLDIDNYYHTEDKNTKVCRAIVAGLPNS